MKIQRDEVRDLTRRANRARRKEKHALLALTRSQRKDAESKSTVPKASTSSTYGQNDPKHARAATGPSATTTSSSSPQVTTGAFNQRECAANWWTTSPPKDKIDNLTAGKSTAGKSTPDPSRTTTADPTAGKPIEVSSTPAPPRPKQKRQPRTPQDAQKQANDLATDLERRVGEARDLLKKTAHKLKTAVKNNILV